MKIHIKSAQQGIELITLHGDLDFHSSQELRVELIKLADRQASKILVDFKKVDYIDSSGLAAFVELFQRMKRYNGQMAFFNLSSGVRDVFEVAKLDSIFRLAQNEKEATEFFS